MADLGVRKLVLHKETIEREGGGTSPDGPVTRVAGIAVVANPHAGGLDVSGREISYGIDSAASFIEFRQRWR